MKKILLLSMCLVLLLSITGCSESETYVKELESNIKSLENKKVFLENENKILEDELAYIETNLDELKNENELKQHIVKIEIKQSHFALNITQNIKDSMNAIEIEIPTSKYFYDSVEIGHNLSDEFRMGSFIMTGSIGSWDITIVDKYILE